MITVEIAHNIQDKVDIIPLGVSGSIRDIWITKHEVQYNVRYFDNAKAINEYFYEEELKGGK